MLDDIFSSFLLNKNQREFCRDASSFLTGVTGKTIAVEIVGSHSTSKEPFFGMRIFPVLTDQLLSLLTDVKKVPSFETIRKEWKSLKEWVLEIDIRTFDRTSINFNPQELTAFTLHEIGHVIYSDRKIEQFYRAYRHCRIKMSEEDKASVKVLYFLYQIPLFLVCGMRNWGVTDRDLREEMFADTTVARLRYGDHLVSAFQKVIRAYGNQSYSTEAKEDAEIESSIQWCNLNACDLIHRKNKLKDELYETGIRSVSNNVQNMIRGIMAKLGITKKDRYTGNIVLESFIDFEDTDFVKESELVYNIKEFSKIEKSLRAAQESAQHTIAQEAFGRKSKKDAIPSQLDVDTIFVEVDRIQNHADRRYVLDLIYNQEEKIERFKERFQYNEMLKEQYGSKMDAMMIELESMRKAVLAKRSFDKQYKVFVKYPAGYEG